MGDFKDNPPFTMNGTNSTELNGPKSRKSKNFVFGFLSPIWTFFLSREYLAPPAAIFVKNYMPIFWKHQILKWFTILYLAIVYIAYHMSRLPFSIAKIVLHPNCTHVELNETMNCGWVPFEGRNYTTLFGMLDFTFTFSYSLSLLLISGPLAERIRPRAFLMLGLIGSGLACCAFGIGYNLNIHWLWWYVLCQIFVGLFQSTGWPTIIAILSEWTEKKTRGRTIGLWAVSLFIGNILGALVPGHFVSANWAMSFHVPGMVMIALGIITPFITIGAPQEVGFDRNGAKLMPSKAEESISRESSTVELQTNTIESSPSVEESSKELTDERIAVSWLKAVRVPGVIEFSIALFFTKLVSYTALFWLPKMMHVLGYSPEISSYLTSAFDTGGMVGAFGAGLIGDSTGMAGLMVTVSLAAAMPPLLSLNFISGHNAIILLVVALFIAGVFVNGPYAYIAGVISSKKGDDDEVGEAEKGVSTVSGIIDGIGSLGGAVGPFLAGYVAGFSYSYIIYIFVVALFLGMLVLVRQVFLELRHCCKQRSLCCFHQTSRVNITV